MAPPVRRKDSPRRRRPTADEIARQYLRHKAARPATPTRIATALQRALWALPGCRGPAVASP